MTEEQNIVQINREKRHYIPFEAKKPRLRSSCPRCKSLDVRKRRDTFDYICDNCGWIGETIVKIEY